MKEKPLRGAFFALGIFIARLGQIFHSFFLFFRDRGRPRTGGHRAIAPPYIFPADDAIDRSRQLER